MRKKKSCEGCVAMELGIQYEKPKCLLGFEFAKGTVKGHTKVMPYVTYIPQEICPKPKTYKELYEIKNTLSK